MKLNYDTTFDANIPYHCTNTVYISLTKLKDDKFRYNQLL